MSTYTVSRTLDLLKRNCTAGAIPPVVMRRGDSGTLIEGIVKYAGDPFAITNYSAKFCAVNAAGLVVRRDASISDGPGGVVTYTVTTDLTAAPGPVLVAYFEFTGLAGEIVTTDTIPFIILDNADLDGPEADEYSAIIDELIASLEAAIEAGTEATGRANSAADAAEAFLDGFTVEYANLSDECKEYIAACASAGVEIATDEDVDYAFGNIVAPAIAGGYSTGRITTEDYEEALQIIFG